MKKIALSSSTVEEIVWQEQLQEIAKLCSELAALKSENVKGLSTVQTTDVTGQAELKGVIANLEAQFDLEHSSREMDKRWYKGALEEIARKQ